MTKFVGIAGVALALVLMQRSTRLAEIQIVGNCNRIPKLSQLH